MRRRLLTLLTIVSLAACGGAQHPATSGVQPGWYVVQFTGARLDARRPDGSPWHTSPGNSAALIIGGLLGLAAGYPALGLTLGEAASDPGGDPLAPAPFIELKLEGEAHRVSPVGRTYAPAWRQPIAIDARRRRGDERVLDEINDAVDGSVIAQRELSLAELLGRSAQTFTGLGAVMSVDLTVAAMPPRQPARYQVAVPATVAPEALTRAGAPGWRPIPVWNGDTVVIEARGAVCPSSRDECFGPGGAAPGRWERYSYVKAAPHASLVAVVPGAALPIGPHRGFRVAEAGSVLLFVNDTDVGNNSGGFEVVVTVTPPD